jgi:hypothetical protein
MACSQSPLPALYINTSFAGGLRIASVNYILHYAGHLAASSLLGKTMDR